jgi:hypothetical protein
MTQRSTAADHRPRFHLGRDRFTGNAVTARRVTRLGTGLTMVDMVEWAARFLGGARG